MREWLMGELIAARLDLAGELREGTHDRSCLVDATEVGRDNPPSPSFPG